MTRALLSLIACLAAALAGCAGGVIEGGMVGAEDAALLEDAELLVFAFAEDAACADLVDEDPAGLDDVIGDAKRQLVDPDQESYTFGIVPPDVSVAYLVLVSSRGRGELGAQPTFAAFEGSIYGIGCRDFTAGSGTRHDLPITVFAAGLR